MQIATHRQVAIVAIFLAIGGAFYWQFFMKMNSRSMDELFEIHASAGTHDSRAAKREILERADVSLLEIFLGQMKSERPVTRGMAAQALGKTRSEKAMDPLMKLIEDEDTEVRFTAAEGFQFHGNLRLVRPLIERLRIEKDDRVRGQIGSALREMTGEKFAHNYDRWLNWAMLNKQKLDG
ncbi:MAG: HEAT repeat domain-containing protein [Planctomycetota bacterium]|jgi:hypothetical protein|nr:HEAT repeat domain-containing protein [Planctomycetota bacterium]